MCVQHRGQPHQEQCSPVLLHPSWSALKYDVPLSCSVCATRVYPSPKHIRNSGGPEHIETVLVCSVDVVGTIK